MVTVWGLWLIFRKRRVFSDMTESNFVRIVEICANLMRFPEDVVNFKLSFCNLFGKMKIIPGTNTSYFRKPV